MAAQPRRRRPSTPAGRQSAIDQNLAMLAERRRQLGGDPWGEVMDNAARLLAEAMAEDFAADRPFAGRVVVTCASAITDVARLLDEYEVPPEVVPWVMAGALGFAGERLIHDGQEASDG